LSHVPDELGIRAGLIQAHARAKRDAEAHTSRTKRDVSCGHHRRWVAYPIASGGVRFVVTASTLTRASSNRPRHQPVRGAHIYVERDLYSHHGIDCGDGTVIDFAGRGGGKNTAIIRRVTLAEFAQGTPVRIRTYGRCYSPEVVVVRAASMIGCSGYDLFSNNCEHFATWCVAGDVSERRQAGREPSGAVASDTKSTDRMHRRPSPNSSTTDARDSSDATCGALLIVQIRLVAQREQHRSRANYSAGTSHDRHAPDRAPAELCEPGHHVRCAPRGRLAQADHGAPPNARCDIPHPDHAGGGPHGLNLSAAVLAGGGMVAGVAVVAAIPLLAAFAFALLAYGLMRCLKPPAPELHARI
jgi:hypothetical protein